MTPKMAMLDPSQYLVLYQLATPPTIILGVESLWTWRNHHLLWRCLFSHTGNPEVTQKTIENMNVGNLVYLNVVFVTAVVAFMALL